MSDKVIIRNSGEWLFSGEDSRLRREREEKQVQGILGQYMDRVYCLNCGADGGMAMKSSLFVKYLCDNCADKFGPELANHGLVQMPESEEIHWRIKEK